MTTTHTTPTPPTFDAGDAPKLHAITLAETAKQLLAAGRHPHAYREPSQIAATLVGVGLAMERLAAVAAEAKRAVRRLEREGVLVADDGGDAVARAEVATAELLGVQGALLSASSAVRRAEVPLSGLGRVASAS
ncbi:hypothetical protein ABZ694_24870 [Streptomyces albidoflavus]|uniref:hypothetical protein n=1 Tax=Streptomyces albidoflavus TaxID=1886 RepID=UPI0033E1DEC8